jgi:lipoprotein-anchoring transpeptidase ErfK/SrfK
MNDSLESLREALENARIYFHQGNHSKARYWARIAAKINPNIEEPWLWLAAVSSPRASIAYLQKALEINPRSQRAKQGMHWAIKRVRLEPNPQAFTQPAKKSEGISYRPTPRPITKSRPLSSIKLQWWIALIIMLAVISSALVSPALGFNINTIFFKPEILMATQVGVAKASNTPTPSNTPTITPSPTPTETPTPTPTDTLTPTPTDTSTPTFTPYPTDTDYPTEEPEEPPYPEPGGEGRWIDVDLSDQLTYAYEGDEIVNVFWVSTGTWDHPTVTGQYYIYVKYEYADMAGPGYYLPDVPYVMYFYDGYGLHGTYWHSNFGTPMSHGCVNLSIPDAEWLYNWADVGTLVNIHD